MIKDATIIDRFFGRRLTEAVIGAATGTILGIGAVPGAIFLSSASLIGATIRTVLNISKDKAPLTLGIGSIALSIFAAMKITSLAGYSLNVKFAFVAATSSPEFVNFLVLAVAAITGLIATGYIFQPSKKEQPATS